MPSRASATAVFAGLPPGSARNSSGCPAPRAGEGVGDALAQDSDHRVGLSSGTLPIRYGTGALTFLKSEFIIAEQQMSTLSGVNDDIESPLIGTA
ncbi:hypothetical protein ACFQYP_26935 [Nonomuraea antimicrobica]